MDQLAYDEERLNEIEKRLDFIQQMKRKYGESVQEVLDYYEKIIVELDQIQNRETHMNELISQLGMLSKSLSEKAETVSLKRQEIARLLEKIVFIANIIRESSPPEATFAKGFSGSPGFVAI